MNEHRERLDPLDLIVKTYGELDLDERMEVAKFAYAGLLEYMRREFLVWAKNQEEGGGNAG